MSLKETKITRWYWKQIGGTLIEEYCVVQGRSGQGGRWVDGLIILGTEKKRLRPRSSYDITGKDVVVVQSKYRRLNMPLMGQTLFARELVRRLKPRNVESVAVCISDDSILRPLLEGHPHCTVKIYPGISRLTPRSKPTAPGE